MPPQHLFCKDMLRVWGDEVERVTEGRVTVRLPTKSMAPPPDQLASVRGGVFDAALQFNGFTATESVGFGLPMLPFVNGSDALANSLALWRTYEKFLAKVDPLAGVKLLGVMAAPGADFYSLNGTPITTLADIKDRKMWALPGVTADLVKNIGAALRDLRI
jgi:TRAP-type C4-dicarboxylate transport system substrate-binding protein